MTAFSAHEKTQKVKDFALAEAGFDLVGITGPTLGGPHAQALDRWLAQKQHASMAYMEKNAAKRVNAGELLPGARSVICVGLNYFHPDDTMPSGASAKRVSKYAYGRDYHKVIGKKLKKLQMFVNGLGSGPVSSRSYVDTGPLLEKAFAQAAGLGFMGKNTLIITKKFASWVFLASVITTLELEQDQPSTASCGTCRLCLDACPTSALLPNFTLDANRCISYLTIESKEPIPKELAPKVGEWAFGCDICQSVCPYSVKSKTTTEPDLYPKKIAGTWLDPTEIKALKTDSAFVGRFAGSPVMRAKRAGLLRNVPL